MRKSSIIVLVFCFALYAIPAQGAEYKFRYDLKPGQTWVVTDTTQVVSEAMGFKSTTRTKRTIKYDVKKGPKSGWVTLSAAVTAQSSKSDDAPMTKQNVLEGMVFKADVHRSGEVRNYSFSGGDPQMAQYMGPMMEPGMFWFPEFPEDSLAVGDEFDVTLKTATPGMEGMGGAGAMKWVTKDTYVLEDVKSGLAYFSIKSRTKMDAGGMDVKAASKGEAIFDMRQGMWVELNTKSKSSMQGMGGEALTIQKLEIEKR
jgi:hypothetical protein